MHKTWGKIGIYVGAAGLLAGGAGIGLVPAALASTGQSAAPSSASQHHAPRAAAALHRVSPFGVAAHRSARHASRRNAPARTGSPDTGTVLWVSNSAPVGGDTSCASPGYDTISGALAANPGGDTINVCGGTYTEQLAITQSVTLQAKGAVTVQGLASPASNLTACDADGGSQPNQDVVDICGAVTVSISGFTIEGNWPAVTCYDSIYGVAVLGGAELAMSRTTVENIGGDPLTDGCQGGVGIEVGLATSATVADPGTATLTNDTVQGYAKNGITVDGAGSNAKITGATVTGAGPTPATAQNGIQVSDGATAAITGGTVSGDECDDVAGGCGGNPVTNTQAAGILAFDSGQVSVTGTTVSACDTGVYNLEDYAWSYYTPPSPFVPVPVTFTRTGLTNRYVNAEFDQGKSAVTSSDLSGGEFGIFEFQYSGQTASAQVSATGDTFTGATTNALDVYSDQMAGDLPVTLTATGDSIGTSNAGGIENDSTSVVSATKDWWGEATGPSVWSFGTGSSVTSDVNFFPWYTDSAMTTPQTCTTGLSKSTAGNDVVLCAKTGTKHATLSNIGTGDVLLIANNGHDALVGSNGGETWMVGSAKGADHFNGNGGTGYLQERGNANDTQIGTGNYTVASS